PAPRLSPLAANYIRPEYAASNTGLPTRIVQFRPYSAKMHVLGCGGIRVYSECGVPRRGQRFHTTKQANEYSDYPRPPESFRREGSGHPPTHAYTLQSPLACDAP